MPYFNESQLEQSIISLLQEQGYDYVKGEDIERDLDEVVLRDDLATYLRNRYKNDGITDLEVDNAIRIITQKQGGTLYTENRHTINLLMDGFSLKREDTTKQNLYIYPVAFDEAHQKHNIFKVVNQFDIVGNQHRIPDAIIFLNGLPVVVFEFKNALKQNTTIEDAYKQLTIRYRRDIPALFKYTAFIVISDGVNNKFGTLYTPYEFFYGWRKVNAKDKGCDGINSLKTMVSGLFRKDRLVDVIHNFVYFPDTSKDERKFICRYPQYFAARSLYQNILNHSKLNPGGDGKGGTYFGATGCGKSLTMLFLSRLLMKSKALCSPTIILITDRTDLDDQLSRLLLNAKQFVGDSVIEQVESRDDLRNKLLGRTSGGVFLTTIQKFSKDINLLSNRANIICISDEAHRSQTSLEEKVEITDKGVRRSYGFAKYLRDSLPNATYVGFTGTPIDPTIEVFGGVVDEYSMIEAVEDGITKTIMYEGRASHVFADISEEVVAINSMKLDHTAQIDLLATQYMERLKRLPYKNTKVKLMEQLLKRVIDSVRKVNKVKAVSFTERLNGIIDKYNDRSDDIVMADEIVTEVATQLAELLEEIKKDSVLPDCIPNIEVKAFYDILKSVAERYGFLDQYNEEQYVEMAQAVKEKVDDSSQFIDWDKRTDIRAQLKVQIILTLAKFKYPKATRDEVFKAILEQAENFMKNRTNTGMEPSSTASSSTAIESKTIPFYPEYHEGCIPLYTLRAACGYFEDGEKPEQEGWVDATGHGFKPDPDRHFVVHAKGDSMQPRIKDGDLCVFKWYKAGTREGEIVLTQCSEFDPDYDGRYTIKKYHSEKVVTEEGWQHSKVELIPLNKDYDVIELDAETEYRIVGVLKCVL